MQEEIKSVLGSLVVAQVVAQLISKDIPNGAILGACHLGMEPNTPGLDDKMMTAITNIDLHKLEDDVTKWLKLGSQCVAPDTMATILSSIGMKAGWDAAMTLAPDSMIDKMPPWPGLADAG